MNETESAQPRFHEDIPLFREAVNFSSARTGFSARLIEKDYFCTVLLAYLSKATDGRVIFKGGTCLAKVLAGFYRLSEDMDFTISQSAKTTRKERSKQVADMKSAISHLAKKLPIFDVQRPLTGSNNSVQYNGTLRYRSLVNGQPDQIRVEVSLREPLLTPVLNGQARTILLDPITNQALVPLVSYPCISQEEAFAEKFRAALTRRNVAIRDFYDIAYALEKLDLQPANATFVDLVRQKLAVSGNPPVDVGIQRWRNLRAQMESQLKPVLRDSDFQHFDLKQAFEAVSEMATRLSTRIPI